MRDDDDDDRKLPPKVEYIVAGLDVADEPFYVPMRDDDDDRKLPPGAAFFYLMPVSLLFWGVVAIWVVL